jgi:rhodanese-related sulfurtransferase
VTTIGREELKAKIDSWGDAVNLPLDRIGKLAPEILPDKDADIVVYCMNSLWPASEEAARELAVMGYTNVRDYAEGSGAGWGPDCRPKALNASAAPQEHPTGRPRI